MLKPCKNIRLTLICDYVIKVRIETDGMKNIFIIKMTAIKRSNLEAPPRFELGVRVLQTRALPLGYGAELCEKFAKKMERETGFGPATFTLAR